MFVIYLIVNGVLNLLAIVLEECYDRDIFINLKFPANAKMFINKEPIYKLENDYCGWCIKKYNKKWISCFYYPNEEGYFKWLIFFISLILPFIIKIKYYKYIIEDTINLEFNREEIKNIVSLEKVYEDKWKILNEKEIIANAFDIRVNELNKEFTENYL